MLAGKTLVLLNGPSAGAPRDEECLGGAMDGGSPAEGPAGGQDSLSSGSQQEPLTHRIEALRQFLQDNLGDVTFIRLYQQICVSRGVIVDEMDGAARNEPMHGVASPQSSVGLASPAGSSGSRTGSYVDRISPEATEACKATGMQLTDRQAAIVSGLGVAIRAQLKADGKTKFAPLVDQLVVLEEKAFFDE